MAPRNGSNTISRSVSSVGVSIPILLITTKEHVKTDSPVMPNCPNKHYSELFEGKENDPNSDRGAICHWAAYLTNLIDCEE